ncbi:MAG: DUF167 domain-containing protein [Rickettsiales bacterium]|jgi:uncharacterized protein YggU (UPF0235/DUF167 family)|nr:DUF167 domain-containing protein [Rickettsiales bacterium]
MNFYAKISPNAKQNKIVDVSTDMFGNYVVKIQIKAVPEKGKANEELINFLHTILNCHCEDKVRGNLIYKKISKSDILILKGQTSSLKQIQIPTLDSKIFEMLIKSEN